jgi:hypothetical protein
MMPEIMESESFDSGSRSDLSPSRAPSFHGLGRVSMPSPRASGRHFPLAKYRSSRAQALAHEIH